jgi:hypothetical protein
MPADKHVIDTNVLLVASAAHAASPFAPDATPVQESVLRKKVLDWLIAFETSERQIVLDYEWIIVDEYKGVNRRDKLTEQDYGLQVVLQMSSTNRVNWFQLESEPDGRTRIRHAALDPVVTDHADRKMIAGVLAGGGRTGGCTLVNSCDTDWYDWQAELEAADVYVEQLIPEWCQEKWKAKRAS